MRQNRNQRLCSAERDPSLRFFDPQRQENRSRTKYFSSLLVVIVRCLVGGKGRKVLNKTGTTPSPVSRCYLSVTSTRW